ncbi:hypothetical protein D3C78_1727380 [compost metagenome]
MDANASRSSWMLTFSRSRKYMPRKSPTYSSLPSAEVPTSRSVGICEVCSMGRFCSSSGLRMGWPVVSTKPASVMTLRGAPITALGMGPSAFITAPMP